MSDPIPTFEEREEKEEKEEKIKKSEKKDYCQRPYPTNPLQVFKDIKNLNKNKIIKLIICLIIIILFAIFNNIEILSSPMPSNLCYKDVILDWCRPLNNFFRGNDIYRIFTTILGSLLLDIVYTICFVSWAFYSPDWGYPANVFFFYFFRGIMQQVLVLGCPDLLYFKYPYFPSIVVGYIQGTDFFWSGHCGFPLIGMMEFIWLKKYYYAGFFAFASFFEIFLMINSREHYTIDIIFGVLFAHYMTFHGRSWTKYIYNRFKFLNNLKIENKKELARIGVDFDRGD